MEQLLYVKFLATYIGLVKAHQIAAVHLHATLFKYPLLIGDVASIDQQLLRRIFLVALVCAALHLVDVPSIAVLAQHVDGTVMTVDGKRCLADVLHALIHPLSGLLGHFGEVEAAVGLFSMRLLVVAKESHGQVTDLIALFETRLQGLVYNCFIRFIHL